MRTHFRAEQLADPSLAEAERNLRACVHCGICTATCPTYVLLGDERDSPRGRIVMMQKMLEDGGTPTDETVTHLDRCLSCLACKTACPSGVDYAHLIDQSRAHIERHYRRPLNERLLRWSIANVLTRPNWTRVALGLARLFSPLTALLPGRLRIMANKARALSSPVYGGGADPALVAGEAEGALSRRIALLPGCVQQVVAPDIDAAAQRLLARRGVALVSLPSAGSCGALAFHLGREEEAKNWAKRLIVAFEAADKSKSFEGALITATGCAAHIADYPHLFRNDPTWHARAEAFASGLVQLRELLSSPACGGGGSPRSGETVGGAAAHPPSASLTSFARHLPRERGRIRETGTPPSTRLRVALQVPCSQQHGLRAPDDGDLLRAAGYEVFAIPEGHLCCGSAGSYSLLQPQIADRLRGRKLANIATVKPDVVATSNIGCLQHLSGPDAPPVVHVVELLDWAEGGPAPTRLAAHAGLMARPEANV